MPTQLVESPNSRLLSLPYDVRHAIYQQLFPPGQQLYLHGDMTGQVRMMMPPDVSIPNNFLLVCRELHREGSEYLYNRYLFNVIGTKRGCLKSYRTFQDTMAKYTRCPIRIDAFSNGDHSATSCICLQAGESQLRVLERRRRGQPTTLGKLKTEVQYDEERCQASGLTRLGIALANSFLTFCIWTRLHAIQLSAAIGAIAIALILRYICQ
ncbi:hypothetical protein K431DRAFT_285919 [Polychaeton citri CBS 116435]|uniref:Uncharacterized protein n=1 Tax=Polychaeton citri CBS 116435 TaxID=1314669 RepID=A0A9P4Q6K9_9PEZI|nr:hypothetical protein K431DRAFT_285919 [Polychaeton citri CBS 116435]